ncbi:hypothetical protein TanjilG_19729 [Lupinus angustifolius]|uniref:AT-hook motif nuclear-localized protein n=1 Tax=Lupinus angustifolius TaxID=3871 RepID=A0A4P1RAA4_LUPAN|nr:hypothetical protein TanjilG_19729 [Lupinus angustifolius]
MKVRSGGLSVSLAGPDGRVIGGVVAGLLTAAGPIQNHEHTLASPVSPGPDTAAEARPILEANPDNVDGENFTTNGDTQNLDATPNVATWNGAAEVDMVIESN